LRSSSWPIPTVRPWKEQSSAPTLAVDVRDGQVRRYEEAKQHKALAVALQAAGTWRSSGWPNAAIAEEKVLEGCQLRYGQPRALVRLGQRAREASASVFYFAGHALELNGRNWLIPASADISGELNLRFEALDLDSVLEQMESSSRTSILLIDACRDNPFRMRLASSRSSGLAAAAAPRPATFAVAAGKPRGWWLKGDRRPGDSAEDRALESCQFYYDQPCVVLAVDDRASPEPADGHWPQRDMVRIHWEGLFDPQLVPSVRADVLNPTGRQRLSSGRRSEGRCIPSPGTPVHRHRRYQPAGR
jgi:hypothetical protein